MEDAMSNGSGLSTGQASPATGEDVYRAFWELPNGLLNRDNQLARLEDRLVLAGFPVHFASSADLKALTPEAAVLALTLLPTLQMSLDPNIVAELVRRDTASNAP